MAPKKGTKAYRDEYVYAYYGINMNTLQVESVWQTRGGRLSSGAFSHTVLPGRMAESELVIVFHLTDIKSIPVWMVQEHSSRIRAELEEKAAKKREERAAKEAAKPDEKSGD